MKKQIKQLFVSIYIENSIDSTKKLLELFKFSEVAGYKISMQRSVAFLCTNNKTSKEINYLIHDSMEINNTHGIYLSKKVKNVCNEYYKTFMKGIEEDTNTWKDYCVYGSQGLILVKMALLTKPSIDSTHP